MRNGLAKIAGSVHSDAAGALGEEPGGLPARYCLCGVVQECRYVRFQLRQIRFVEIHHVAGVVILQGDVLLEVWRQAQVRHGVFGGEERRGQVVDAILDFDVEVGLVTRASTRVLLRRWESRGIRIYGSLLVRFQSHSWISAEVL